MEDSAAVAAPMKGQNHGYENTFLASRRLGADASGVGCEPVRLDAGFLSRVLRVFTDRSDLDAGNLCRWAHPGTTARR